jgi:hypothetical protein
VRIAEGKLAGAREITEPLTHDALANAYRMAALLRLQSFGELLSCNEFWRDRPQSAFHFHRSWPVLQRDECDCYSHLERFDRARS